MKSFFYLQKFAMQKGTSGNDNLAVKNSGNLVYGYAGNDSITNIFDKVTISAGAGNDYVWSHGGNVQILGETGKDFLISSGDSVKTGGGVSNDSVFSYGRYATVTGDAGNDYIENQGYSANISGGAGKDTIITSGYSVTVSGGKGNDFVSFNNDSSGNNVFQYSSGDGNDTVYGFNSNDVFRITKGSYSTIESGKNLILKIGKGSVTFLDAIYTPIQVRLSDGTAETVSGSSEGTSSGEYISNHEDDTVVSGTSKGDTIYNSGNYVTLNGDAGADSIYSSSNDVYVSGDSGNDTIISYADYATINGGAGSDIVTLASYSKNNLIQYASGDGNDTIFGFDSNDTLNITKGTYSTTKSDSDFIVTIGKQKITLKDAVTKDYDKVIIKNSDGTVLTYNDWTAKANVSDNKANNVKITVSDGSYGYISNDSGNDVTLQGGAGHDHIYNYEGDALIMYGGADDDVLKNDYGKSVTLTGGEGNDIIDLNGENSSSNLITYASGDGNDMVYGFKAGDSLKITRGTYKASASGTNVIVTVGSGKITLRGAASKPVTIIDSKGKTSTKIYGKSTSALFAEDNFVTSDNLDSIVKNNLSAVDYKIETQNFEKLCEEKLIIFAEK